VNVSVVIATCGDPAWSDLAWSRAYPSAAGQVDDSDEIVIDHLPGLSVPAARNELAARATGEWLCFLDADDELDLGYLAAMGSAELECALLVPALERVYPDGHRDPSAIPNRGGWPVVNECVVGTLIERDLFACLGGFRELASLEDYDLFLRAFDDGAGLVYVPDAVYREHVSQAGRNADQSVYGRVWQDHLDRIAA